MRHYPPVPMACARRLLLCLTLGLPLAGAPALEARAAAELDPLAWPKGAAGVPLDPKVEAMIDGLIGRMTLEDKVGQMLQADVASASPEDVRTYRLGSVLAGGNSAPNRDLRGPAADWVGFVRDYSQAAVEAVGEHPAIPLLFGIDAVHGHGHARGATLFPHNVALGAAGDAALVERIGAATAAEVTATGIDWVFAPTVAVARDPRWGRAYESYSSDPTQVAAYGTALVRGLQGVPGPDGILPPRHVVATLKHFLADGATRDGRDQGQAEVSAEELRRIDGAGYVSGVPAGALTVMASYSSWQGTKMHASRTLLTDVLKERLGFNGFVIGDWNGHEQVPGCTKFDCPAAILAGVDMLMAADSWKQFRAHTLDEVRDGTIPLSRIDDAVRRILRVKILAGLFQAGTAAQQAKPADLAVIGSAAHRALAREAVRRSLVLLKNERGVLPLRAGAHVLVAGAAADDIGLQCGGWSIDWQGDHNANADFPGATSIYGGLAAALTAGGGSAEFSADGSYARRPDVAVVVFGERPYAEFDGDRETLQLGERDVAGLELLRRFRERHIPAVAVLLSGRPLWMNPELNAADAFVAAWLPGSEGAGVADVLVGKANGAPRYDFAGRLPFPWPATAAPAGGSFPVLYAAGYGLTYGKPARAVVLPEDPAIGAGPGAGIALYTAGHVVAPWSMMLRDTVAELRVTLDREDSEGGALGVAADGRGAVATFHRHGELMIAGRTRDWSRPTTPDLALVVTYAVESPPQGRVTLGLRCGRPYGAVPEPPGEASRRCGLEHGAMQDVTEAMRAPPGTWHRLTVPLSCLREAGADLRVVGAPFALAADAPFAVRLGDVRLAPLEHAAACGEPRGWDPAVAAP